MYSQASTEHGESHGVEFYKMRERENFQKGIEHLIDEMMDRLPEEMQSALRKHLAHQREIAWIARAEALKAREEQKRLEEAATRAAADAEIELSKLLVIAIAQQKEQLSKNPKDVQKRVELLKTINEKYTEFEVAKAKCPKNDPPDAIDVHYVDGLYNPRYLKKVLIEEIVQAEDRHARLTMLMIDIDDLKLVNAISGHIAGNRVLESVADIVRSSVRLNDLVFRSGGDEFVVVLPGIGLDPALHIGENVRDMIGTSFLALVGKITVTIAGCEYEAGEGAESFMARLDDAMFRAKRGGEDDGMSSVWAPVR
jgi:diguanylate cyclase (GGDEF)-like protein